MVELVWSDINIHTKIHVKIAEKLPHKVQVLQNLHRKALKCLAYCQSSHHFQVEYRQKGTLVYALIIENPERVAVI
jgi:hypothetical protein